MNAGLRSLLFYSKSFLNNSLNSSTKSSSLIRIHISLFLSKLYVEKLIIQINEEVRKGNIIPVDPKQLLMNILSLAIFPIIAAPLLKGMFETDDFEFSGIIEKRKKELPEWIINAIKPRN